MPQESRREEISNVLGCRMDQKETQLGDGQVISIYFMPTGHRGNDIVMYKPLLKQSGAGFLPLSQGRLPRTG